MWGGPPPQPVYPCDPPQPQKTFPTPKPAKSAVVKSTITTAGPAKMIGGVAGGRTTFWREGGIPMTHATPCDLMHGSRQKNRLWQGSLPTVGGVCRSERKGRLEKIVKQSSSSHHFLREGGDPMIPPRLLLRSREFHFGKSSLAGFSAHDRGVARDRVVTPCDPSNKKSFQKTLTAILSIATKYTIAIKVTVFVRHNIRPIRGMRPLKKIPQTVGHT